MSDVTPEELYRTICKDGFLADAKDVAAIDRVHEKQDREAAAAATTEAIATEAAWRRTLAAQAADKRMNAGNAPRAPAAENRMNAGNAPRAQAAGNRRNAGNAPAAAAVVAPAAAATNAALNRLAVKEVRGCPSKKKK
jgi:hypothetical protein